MAWSAKTDEIIPAQCRAARALLDWGEGELAARTNLSLSSVVSFERNIRLVSAEAIAAMRFVFEDAGIEFVWEQRNGHGVILKTGETGPIAAAGLLQEYDRFAAAMPSQNQWPS